MTGSRPIHAGSAGRRRVRTVGCIRRSSALRPSDEYAVLTVHIMCVWFARAMGCARPRARWVAAGPQAGETLVSPLARFYRMIAMVEQGEPKKKPRPFARARRHYRSTPRRIRRRHWGPVESGRFKCGIGHLSGLSTSSLAFGRPWPSLAIRAAVVLLKYSSEPVPCERRSRRPWAVPNRGAAASPLCRVWSGSQSRVVGPGASAPFAPVPVEPLPPSAVALWASRSAGLAGPRGVCCLSGIALCAWYRIGTSVSSVAPLIILASSPLGSSGKLWHAEPFPRARRRMLRRIDRARTD